MTAPKKTTAKAAVKTAGQPGPKPDFQVVEETLKCQTRNGEISLSLIVPFDAIEKMIDIEGQDEKKIPSFLMNEVLPEEASKTLRGLEDGAEAFRILTRYAEAIGERLGASLGESVGSSAS